MKVLRCKTRSNTQNAVECRYQVERAVKVGDLSVARKHRFLTDARITHVRLRCANGDFRGAQGELAALESTVSRFPQLAQRMASSVARRSP